MVMFCTKTKWCDFFLCTTADYFCKQVQFEEPFCGSILPTLRCFLPELTLKAKSIREPKDWVMEEETFFKSGQGCHLRKCMHTYVFTYSSREGKRRSIRSNKWKRNLCIKRVNTVREKVTRPSSYKDSSVYS